MTEPFFRYTEGIVQFTQADKELLAGALILKKADAKTELVVAGRPSDELFFILRGCVRKYYLKGGEQITVSIISENNFVGAFTSLITGSKSSETIECLEQVEMLVLSKKNLDRLYLEVPLMNEFIRKILEQTVIQFQRALTSFILDTPEERYERLVLENPGILNRVPQHMLATYLGITATSLSRIRKRIFKKT